MDASLWLHVVRERTVNLLVPLDSIHALERVRYNGNSEMCASSCRLWLMSRMTCRVILNVKTTVQTLQKKKIIKNISYKYIEREREGVC